MPDTVPDRRVFLQAATGALWASSTMAATAQESNAPPVTVGVIGAGARGCDLIRALTTIASCHVTAVCDPYGPHRERGWQYAGPLTQTFDNHRALLDQARPQAVVIATPLVTHAELALAALDAGCAVYCEKMLCFSLEEARRVVAAVEARRAVFQVGLQRRAHAIYRQAAAMAQTGMLGRITAIKAQWHRNSDWRRPVPVRRDDPDFVKLDRQLNWRLYRDQSQGLIAELGAHQLDIVNWVLGTPPESVIAVGGNDYWRDGRDVADNVFCVYDYRVTPMVNRRAPPLPPGANNDPYTVRVTYSTLQNNAYEGASELILGTQGTLFLTPKKGLLFREQTPEEIEWSTRPDKQAAIVASGKTLKLSNDPWAHRGSPFEIDAEGDDTRDALVSFLDHVRNRDPHTICTARDGLMNAATVFIANEAQSRDARVRFPALA